jgi:hypothetical protein
MADVRLRRKMVWHALAQLWGEWQQKGQSQKG